MERSNTGLYRVYALVVMGIFAASMAGVYVWKMGRGDFDVTGIWAAGVINVLNSVIGFRVILGSLEHKSTQKFFIASLGSMSVRLFVILIMVVAGLMLFNFNKISFIFALFCYYFTFLFLETIILVKRINKQKES
ncbi:MAG: hypothetical protein NTY74_06190 [Ignavibacteriae bacterium]|nr:hypothetical protein [Ignavibacteriota bacterium]